MQEELLKEVRHITGLKMDRHRDFVALSELIFKKTHETISPTTLKRLWGVVTDQQCNPSMHTLNLIAEAINYKSYKLFCKRCERRARAEGNSSELFFGTGCYAEDLDEGDEITVSWLPDRECVFRYLGDKRFKVIENRNSKLDVGDMFSCDAFIENEVLSLYKLSHGGKDNLCYRAGLNKGIKFSIKEKNNDNSESNAQENGGGKIAYLRIKTLPPVCIAACTFFYENYPLSTAGKKL